MADDLFAINLSGDDESQDDAGAGRADRSRTRQDKNHQSEEAFQKLKSEYRPKMENGEIWKTIKLPLGHDVVPKAEAQELLHATEELYFYRRYAEGAEFVGRALEGEPKGLDDDTKAMLVAYRRRCLEKSGLDPGSGYHEKNKKQKQAAPRLPAGW